MAESAQHAISVDVEDYRQILSARLGRDVGPVSSRFQRNMRGVLSLLDETGTRATFFVSGTVAEQRADLVREWHAAGHEIASHGYSHAPIREMTRKEFAEEATRSKGLLEDAVGEPVSGYRAPEFSIETKTLWALEVLAECGFEYDSSIVPVRTRRYGIDGFDPEPSLYELPSGRGIVEIPLTAARVWGLRMPVAGGGWFRLLSTERVVKEAKSRDEAGSPFVMYCHPREFSPEPLSAAGLASGWRERLLAGSICFKWDIGRRKAGRTVRRLLSEFRFSTLGRLAARVKVSGDHQSLTNR